MSKRRGFVALAALSIVAAVGGGGSAIGAGEASAVAASARPRGAEPVELVYSSWNLDSAGRGLAFRDSIETFNASQDEVRLTPNNIPFSDFNDTLLTQLGAGEGPDVFNVTIDIFNQLVEQGMLADVTDHITRPTDELLSPDATAWVDGRRYGIVHNLANYQLFINRDLFDAKGIEPPTTPEEFFAAAEALTDGDVWGMAMRHSMAEQSVFWWDLTNWVYGYGGRWTDEDGRPTLTDPAVVAAVADFARMANAGVHVFGAAGQANRQMFWEGKVAMMIDNSQIPTILMAENPDLALEVVPLPFETAANVMIPTYMVVNANSDHPELAARYLDYFITDESQLQIALEAGTTIGAAPVDLPDDVLDQQPWIPVFNEAIDDGVLAVPVGYETSASRFTTAVLEQVDQVIIAGKDAAEAMADAQAEIEGF